MAAFLRRALDLPDVIHQIPIGFHSAMTCSKDGERCSLTVDLVAGRIYRIQEGLFQVIPASGNEEDQFDSPGTSFTLTLDASSVNLQETPQLTAGGVMERRWQRDLSFPAGTHTLVGTWRWDGTVIQTNTLTLRVSG
jgi:hypothetical protein